MAIYRTVSLSFWEDSKIVDDFTPEDKYFMLYLLTNPHTNLIGCYEISYRQMVNETGYNKDTIERLIYRMKDIHRVADYDEETKEMFIRNWNKYNWTKSEKLHVKLIRTFDFVKSERFKKEIFIIMEQFGINVEEIGYQYPIDTSVSVTVTDTVTVLEKGIVKGKNKPYQEVIDYLNLRTSRRFKVTKDVQRLVNARFKEGFTLQDFKDVIDKKCIEWIENAEMKNYLRPQTLFGTKFQAYLNQEVVKKKSSNPFLDMEFDEKGNLI